MTDLGAAGAAIVASAPLPVLVFDEQRCVAVCNPAAERLLQVTAADVIGRPAAALFPAAASAETLDRIERAARGELGHLEVEVQVEAGPAVEVGMSFAPLRGEDGAVLGIVGVGRDISERKQLEAELAQLADSYRVLSRTSSIGMYRFSFDDGLRVDHVNPAFEEALAVTAEELQVDPSALWERLPAAAAARFDANRRDDDAALWPIEFPWTRRDGDVVVVSVTEVPIRDRSGRLRAVHGIAQDITAVRRQEQALAEALALERAAGERLRRVDELRRLFLQAASHELRTPLTTLLGFSETLRDRQGYLDERSVVQLSDRIHQQATKMQRLLDDLLDIERLNRGVLQLSRRRVDLAALVQAVVAEHGDPGVEVTAASAPAWVDAAKIERIVVNLVANARKHVGEDAVIHVDVRPSGDRVVLLVADDGPGVPDELAEAVFEPFRQGPSAGTSASPGTGIGLTLVAQFAALHGGTARVERSELGGAAFIVELPVSGVAAVGASAAAGEPSAAGGTDAAGGTGAVEGASA